jgi:LacI family transcriptional regulator
MHQATHHVLNSVAMKAEQPVLLLVESSASYGRGCLCGIARYARTHTPWVLHHVARGIAERQITATVKAARIEGIIARVETPSMLKTLMALKVPTVAIAAAHKVEQFPVVDTDHRIVVKLAIEHLLANGFTELAYCGLPGIAYSDDREAAFFATPLPARVRASAYARSQTLGRWLRSLPKPVGILVCHDSLAKTVLQTCDAIGLRVPYEVAVVGVDNDEVICELATPPLSSVVPNVEAVGVQAAKTLDKMLQKIATPAEVTFIPPLGLEIRASSDVEALHDPVLAKAVRYIRERTAQGVSVKEVMSHVGASRSTLERRFLMHLNCTPHDYIARRQVEQVRRLLLDTTYPLRQVARMAGFKSAAHMVVVFRMATGMTPGQFRRAVG